MSFFNKTVEKDIERFLAEDEISGNAFYLNQLPSDNIECLLKIKSDLILSGLPYLVATFNFLGADLKYFEFEAFEGKKMKKGDVIKFKLPFNIALTGERIALNLVQNASSISTFTSAIVEKTKNSKIKILDTRKTTPGLRNLQKYAVNIGGGYNHRMSQTDVFMIKDNHKTFFGGLKNAYEYFQSLHAFYNPIVAEIHSLEEFELAKNLGIKHVMLDNFSPENIKQAIARKNSNMTIEISGGINSSNIDSYLIDGVDAISMGALTYGAPHVDISMKMSKL